MVSQTEAISTQVTNQDTVECDITLSLVAPNFTLQPTDNQRLIQLAPTQSSTVTWRVTPTTVGLFTLAFTAGNASAADRHQRHEWQWVHPAPAPDVRLPGDLLWLPADDRVSRLLADVVKPEEYTPEYRT